jgi:ParB family chromosome partitioning protein
MFKTFAQLADRMQSKGCQVEMDKIFPNPHQPRKVFDEEELKTLSQSITRYGVIQPIVIRRGNKDDYEIIAGERRYRAAHLAGLEKIPAFILDANDQLSCEMALVENLQRSNLNFFEEAQAISSMMELFSLNQLQVAKRLGKNQSTIANKLRILRLSAKEQVYILDNGLTERHARALLKIEDPTLRKTALEHMVKRQLNVAQSDEYIEALLSSQKKEANPKRVVVLKDVRIFFNTINHALDMMKRSGIDAVSYKSEQEGFIRYVIEIPTAATSEAKAAGEAVSSQLTAI